MKNSHVHQFRKFSLTFNQLQGNIRGVNTDLLVAFTDK